MFVAVCNYVLTITWVILEGNGRTYLFSMALSIFKVRLLGLLKLLEPDILQHITCISILW